MDLFFVRAGDLNLSQGVTSSFTSIDLNRFGVNVTFFVFPDLIKSSKSLEEGKVELVGEVIGDFFDELKLKEIELRFSLLLLKKLKRLLLELDLTVPLLKIESARSLMLSLDLMELFEEGSARVTSSSRNSLKLISGLLVSL